MSTQHLPAALSLAAAMLILAAITPVVHAADPTPGPGAATVDVDLGAEPLLPYIAALVVASAVLIAVGVVATQVNRRSGHAGVARRDPVAWWACRSCATSNAGDRETCFACAAPRTPPTD